MKHGAYVESVEKRSPAAKAGISAGDSIIAMNGAPLRDVIDYMFRSADETVVVDVGRKNGTPVRRTIHKQYGEPLGITFSEITFDRMISCINKCVFCFVDQMPSGMRKSLYIKDDDYRLSFLQGCFLTLTNLSPNAIARIIEQHMSPLYVSVHATDPAVRRKMLCHKNAGKIMDQLSYLAGKGISVHTQIVVCPGYNDGKELVRSIRDLASLSPSVLSIAVVPVGLTAKRSGLPSLRMMTPQEARSVIDQVAPFQERYQKRFGIPLVYLADEFYLLADETIPPARHYAGFPQIENGVGLIRTLYDSFAKSARTLPASIARKRIVTLVTGVSGKVVLAPIAKRLSKIKNLTVRIAVIPNRFFGEMVTVAGLITGSDIVAGLKDVDTGDAVIVPSVMCQGDRGLFLDDMTVKALSKRIQKPVLTAESLDAADLVRTILH